MVLRRRLWGTVRGRGGTKGASEWGLCVWQGKKKNRPQLSFGCLRTAFHPNANRTLPDRGADTPLLGFKIYPSPPPILDIFDTSTERVRVYPKNGANRSTKTQGLIQNRPGLSRKTPRNRVCPVSAPRFRETRCGQTPNSVQGGRKRESLPFW